MSIIEPPVPRPLVLERSAGIWLRAGAIGFGAILIGTGRRPVPEPLLVACGVLLGVFMLWRAVPLGAKISIQYVLATEAALATVVALVTGGWSSPFGLYLPIPVLFLALSFGRSAYALVATMAVLLTVEEFIDESSLAAGDVTSAAVPLVLAAVVGVIGRGTVTQAETRHNQTLGRIHELSHVNALLSTLHDLVRSTPAPLTVEDILGVIRDELDELFEADVVLLLMADEGGRWWRPVHVQGAPVAREFAYNELPPALLEQGPSSRPVLIGALGENEGLTPRARSGAYLWLWSRGQASGLLALESFEQRDLPDGHRDMLDRLSAPLSLAIDNAVWFQRLRTLGAEEERQRIGAQLHDRFAQSLVYIAGELDRSAKRHPDDLVLAQLHQDVRNTLQDLRETLRELRLRCTEERGLVPTLQEYLERFGDRFGLITTLSAPDKMIRPPLPVENQLLRIAQDLVALAQREGGATSVAVRFATEAGRLRLVVSDDGRGTPEDDFAAEPARIIAGVRDRASAVGGLVDVFARPGEGTEVAVTVRGLL